MRPETSVLISGRIASDAMFAFTQSENKSRRKFHKAKASKRLDRKLTNVRGLTTYKNFYLCRFARGQSGGDRG